jgi:hypothetical protein
MPTFAQWEAKRRGGQAGVQADSSPTPMNPNDIQDVSPDVIASAEKFLARPALKLGPTDTDASDPTGAKLSLTKDPSRYFGHAAKGLARSPIDLVKGLLNLPAQVVHGLGVDLPALIADPSLVTEIPQAAKDAVEFANTHPDEMGSLLGQSLLAPKVPGAANAALRHGPTAVGRTMSAVGRGAEAVGTSKIAKMASKFGPMEAALRMDPYGIAVAAAPKVLEVGGKALQKGGAALEGLDLAYKGKVPFAREAGPEVVDPADVMREKVAGAREDVSAGFSRPVASKLNGLKSSATDISHPTADVVSPGELFPYQRDAIRGLEDTAKGDRAWSQDLSAQPEGVTPPPAQDLSGSLAELSNAVRRSKLSPIEKFYEDDPQSRGVGGQIAPGRMTGQWTEGQGGLSDIAAGRFTRHPMPPPSEGGLGVESGPQGPRSPLDDLSQLARQMKDPATMQRILDEFGKKGR